MILPARKRLNLKHHQANNSLETSTPRNDSSLPLFAGIATLLAHSFGRGSMASCRSISMNVGLSLFLGLSTTHTVGRVGSLSLVTSGGRRSGTSGAHVGNIRLARRSNCQRIIPRTANSEVPFLGITGRVIFVLRFACLKVIEESWT